MTVAPHVFLGLNALGQWMLDCSSEQDKSTSYALFKEIEDFEYEIIGNIYEK